MMKTFSTTTLLLLLLFVSSCYTFSPKGSAAVPLQKKKVAVVGAGGYLGAITFGFLQRASSLFETGIARQCRCIGSTAQTAVALNRLLGKHFILAQADETFIKLTNMQSIDSIQQRLEGMDAVILGTEMGTEIRPVTGGTYETSPNDKAYEIYWDYRKGSRKDDDNDDSTTIIETIVDNTLKACQLAGVQYLTVVGREMSTEIREKLDATKIPYTFIRYSGDLVDAPDYTYKKGVQGNLVVTLEDKDENTEGGDNDDSSDSSFMFREDLAAFCIQSIQSLDWKESRCLHVRCDGRKAVPLVPSGKRPDQEWCVNSHILGDKLAVF